MGPDDPYWFNDHLSRHRGTMALLRRGQPVVPGIPAGNGSIEQIGGGRSNESVAFLAPCATLIGNVHLSADSSVFYKAILKADVAAHGMNTICTKEDEESWRSLEVGSYERKKDAGMFDTASGVGHPTVGGANGGGIYVGKCSNIQDGAMVTSYEGHTEIGDYVTVGHNAHIHSAKVGDEALIGMGAILNPGSVIESQSFVAVVSRGTVVKSGEIWGGFPARKLRDMTEDERRKLRIQAERYVDVGRSQEISMDLGGNVPDSFIENELLPNEESTTDDHEPQALLGVASKPNR